ncbi:MAG: alpha/beta fold hydrolase, partial [Microthrixaceae bacterium]|nr:alpha/beta fold hydrolase [Microthrixaceae bacterium]
AEQIADDCERVAANLLAHISTDSTVKDMEAIRRALGDEQLSFYGFSYGTALGSFYADEFPDRVRAIVLDGVIDPDADLEEFLTAQTQGFEDSLDDMFDSCGSSCPDGGADALYDKLAAEVEREPIGAGSRTLGPAELATAAISATYSPGGGPGLARALSEADDGNTAALLTLARQYYDGADFTPYLAIECVDQAHPENETEWAEFVERLEEISPRLGASIGYELLPCATWPVEPVDPRPFPTATGSKPILVVGNTGDAATPFLQAEKMAARLDNAVLLTHEGTGHTSYGNACVDEITAAYLVDLTLPDNDTICRG